MSDSKPGVFIASSVEGLAVADAINLNLDHDTYPTLWRTGTFQLSSNTIDDLVKKSSTVDFAIFVFTPDDAAIIREHAEKIVRDNVVFELGLFVGSLGNERCFIVRPRGTDMHLPSDLLGVTTADYASDRPDNDLASALNAACKLIKDRIINLGVINRKVSKIDGAVVSPVANPPQYTLNSTDFKFLAECVDTQTSAPNGLSFYQIASKLKRESENLIKIGAIKLMRLGYVEQIVATDSRDGEDYYAYSITPNGLDVFLKNEIQYSNALVGGNKQPPNFSDMDKDTPF